MDECYTRVPVSVNHETAHLPPPQAPGQLRNRFPATWGGLARALGPWLLLAAFLVWGWRGQDFFRSVPEYGDILEFTWALTHYDQALQSGANPLLAPNAFFPGGWNLTTYGQGFVFLPLLLPLHRLGGAAFAYNLVVFLTFIVAFAGAFALGRRWFGTLLSAAFAILVSFWGLRWFQTIGHINILWGAAFMPWLIWSIERSVARTGRRRLAWLAGGGALWALSAIGSLYFVFINGLLTLGWLLGLKLSGKLSWRQSALSLAVIAGVALLLSAPMIVTTARASQAIGAQFYPFADLAYWSASLNSLPIPYIHHPWLSNLSRALYKGSVYESGAANFGLAATAAALIGAVAALSNTRRRKIWWPAVMVAVFGLVLALGVALQWDSAPVRSAAFAPVNRLLWQVGRALKPAVFADAPPVYDEAIPLPGFLLTVIVPFFERARVMARYGFAASIGVFLLRAFALSRIRPRSLRWLAAAVLVFEVVPPPLASLPYPPAPHPVFEWLARQDLSGGAALDLVAAHPDVVVPVNRGESVWASLLHGQPIVAGASSVWPAHSMFLHEWLASRPHALAESRTITVLRQYRTRYLLLHMASEWEEAIRAEAAQNPELRFVDCFAPASGPTPWPEPICAFEVLPSQTPSVNLVLDEGWSKPEQWGVWAEGAESQGIWIAAAPGPAQLSMQVFPNCLPDQKQALTVRVNGEILAEHQWNDCEPWGTVIDVPQRLTRLGRNDVVFKPAYAFAPAGDTRELSVGFSQLKVE